MRYTFCTNSRTFGVYQTDLFGNKIREFSNYFGWLHFSDNRAQSEIDVPDLLVLLAVGAIPV